jgi:hypothetical protein
VSAGELKKFNQVRESLHLALTNNLESRMTNCPPFEDLITYLEGETDQPVWQAHLDSPCPRCAANRAWYERIKRITESDETVNAPPWVLQRAVRLFQTPSRSKPLIERAGRVVAALIFDSFARAGFAGARAIAGAERQLLYRADDYSIDLQLASQDETCHRLSGQILRESEFRFESVAEIELSLVRDGQTICSMKTSRFGEFAIAELDNGEYDLHLQNNEICITVVGLSVA